MDQTVLTVEYMNERNRALTKAGEGIVAARKSLDQLEDVLRGTAMGKFPNIGEVADTTHKMERTLSDSDTTYIIITSVYLVAFVLLILWKEDQKLAEKILCAILAAVALWAMWFFFMGGARFA